MPTNHIYDSNGNNKGSLALAETPIGSRRAVSRTIQDKIASVTSGVMNGNYERLISLFPGVSIEHGCIVPGSENMLYFQPRVSSEDYGTLCALNKILKFFAHIPARHNQGDMSQADFLDKLSRLIERIGGWGIIDPSLIEFLRANTLSTGQQGHDQEYNDANRFRAMQIVQTQILNRMNEMPMTRKVIRRANVLARAWAAEACLAIFNNINASRLSAYSQQSFDIMTVAALAIKDYAHVRGSRLDNNERSTPALSQSDAVQRSFAAFNDRIRSIARQLIHARINSTGAIDYSEGGPAFEFNGYRINVVMAYIIMDRVILRYQHNKAHGNTHAHMDGNFWPNDDRTLPIIMGSWNKKHEQTCILVQECARLIAKFHPIPNTNGDGWTVDLGASHDDVSVNAGVNADIRVCTGCNAIGRAQEGTLFAHGDTYMGGRINYPSRPNACYCENCVPNRFVRVFDTGDWESRSETAQIEFVLHRSTGERTSNARVGLSSMGFYRALERLSETCATCGSRVYDSAKMSAYIDNEGNAERQALIRSMANGIPLNSDLGGRIYLSAGRSPSSENYNMRLNYKAEVHDSGNPTVVCPRCCNLNALYQDPNTGLYYSSIDNSPMAPEYGYKVPDPSGRFSSRCLGIEFETGPGSSNVNGKDEFLNERCSDPYHVWNIHSDGSLMGGACEITTPPVAGLAIVKAVDAMFELAKKYGFSIENRQAGMHIHCDTTDLFEAMMPYRNEWLKNRESTNTIYHRFCKAYGKFGDALAQISRQFVSAYRRHNQYCSGGFGIRSWSVPSGDPMSAHESTVGGGRQAVCVHMHNGYSKRSKVTYTLENRIWPSSNSKEYTLARAELTQRSVDRFIELAMPFLQQRGDERAEAYRALMEYVDAMSSVAPFTRDRLPLAQIVRIPDLVCDLIGMSSEGKAALIKLHRRFFYISYYAHEHGLTMNSPEIIAMRDESLHNSGASEAVFSSLLCAEEVAGIMAQKGFGNIRNQVSRTPLATPDAIVMMDTTMSSTAHQPIVTDQSDLCGDAPLSRTHH